MTAMAALWNISAVDGGKKILQLGDINANRVTAHGQVYAHTQARRFLKMSLVLSTFNIWTNHNCMHFET